MPKTLKLLWLVPLTLMLLSACAEPEPQAGLADGGRADFGEWSGRWIVINYWAEWCAPCRHEIPELNRLHREGADGGTVVLGVNFDGVTGAKLNQLIDTMGIEFPVLLQDPRDRWDQPVPAVLPSTLVINPAGELEHVLVGPQTYESLSRAMRLTTNA